MLKIVNNMRFFPKWGVRLRFNDYLKYFHWLCFYFYWHHKSIWDIEDDNDKSIKKAWRDLK
jgi:hypothetical protein